MTTSRLLIVATYLRSSIWNAAAELQTEGGIEPCAEGAQLAYRVLDGAHLIVMQQFSTGELPEVCSRLAALKGRGYGEVIIANHDGSLMDGDGAMQHQSALQGTVGCPVTAAYFSHDPEDKIYVSIDRLLQHRDAEHYDAAVQAVKRRRAECSDPQLALRDWLRHTHHKLSNLLLPIAVDLSGWQASGWDGEYEREIARAWAAQPFTDVLTKARTLLDGDGTSTRPGLAQVPAAFGPDVRSAVGRIEAQFSPSESKDCVIANALNKEAEPAKMRENDAAMLRGLQGAFTELDTAFRELIDQVEAIISKR